MDDPVNVIILLGPPGSGKGTQSDVLQRELNIPAISTGEVLRAEIAAGTPLGQKVKDTIGAGRLADDDLVNEVVAAQISQPAFARGFVLDGYPRTVNQARFLDGLLRRLGFPEPLVIHLEADTETIFERLAARRLCPCCRRIYNQILRPSKDGVHCDVDGTPLIIREDDKPAVIRDRLKAYRELSEPLIDFYRSRNYVSVDGNLPPETVFQMLRPRFLEHMAQIKR
jgi:adenylate kinase